MEFYAWKRKEIIHVEQPMNVGFIVDFTLQIFSLGMENSGIYELEKKSLEFRASEVAIVCDVRLLLNRILLGKGAPNIDFKDPFYFWLNSKMMYAKQSSMRFDRGQLLGSRGPDEVLRGQKVLAEMGILMKQNAETSLE